jgi:hypothetical protein
VPAGRIVERLMLLDAVVADPELNWLDTQAEKVAYFTTLPCSVQVEKLPRTRHADLLRTLPLWTLRLVFPRLVFPHQIAHAYARLEAIVHDELKSPLHPHTVEELKWYFGQLRATPRVRTNHTDERFERASEAFERPRYYRLYRQWLKDGDGRSKVSPRH